MTGLLTDIPRKNCDGLAAVLATTSTERLQHLLTDASWDPVALDEQRVRQLAASGSPGGVLVLDDTGLPKQGKASAGVVRQYSGTWGKKGNCQVLVSAAYVEDRLDRSDPLHWPVSAQLYLPRPGQTTRTAADGCMCLRLCPSRPSRSWRSDWWTGPRTGVSRSRSW
jgi:SRSO17 transposase